MEVKFLHTSILLFMNKDDLIVVLSSVDSSETFNSIFIESQQMWLNIGNNQKQ